MRIQGVAQAIRLTTTTASVAAGAAFDKIKRAGESATKVTASITVRLVDAAGHSRVVKRTVKLTM